MDCVVPSIPDDMFTEPIYRRAERTS